MECSCGEEDFFIADTFHNVYHKLSEGHALGIPLIQRPAANFLSMTKPCLTWFLTSAHLFTNKMPKLKLERLRTLCASAPINPSYRIFNDTKTVISLIVVTFTQSLYIEGEGVEKSSPRSV